MHCDTSVMSCSDLSNSHEPLQHRSDDGAWRGDFFERSHGVSQPLEADQEKQQKLRKKKKNVTPLSSDPASDYQL